MRRPISIWETTMQYKLIKHDGRSCELSADDMMIITRALDALRASGVSFGDDIERVRKRLMDMRNPRFGKESSHARA